MLPSYKLIAVPLDSVAPGTSPNRFDVRIVATLEFPQGDLTATEVASVVTAHPLLKFSSDVRLNGFALEFNAWQAAGHVIDPSTAIRVTLSYIGKKQLTSLRETLSSYLFRSNRTTVAPLLHDPAFDTLGEDDFVNVTEAHDDLTSARSDFHARAARSLGLAEILSLKTFSPDSFSFERARWLNSYAQTLLLSGVFGYADNLPALAGADSTLRALTRLRSAVPKIARRLRSPASPPAVETQKTLQTVTPSGRVDVSIDDPNVAIHAALKNSLIGEACGIVTRWRADSAAPLIGDYVFVLDLASLNVDPSTVDVTTEPIALRRASHTHPLGFSDIRNSVTSNSALASLNDEHAAPRYRATAINAETAVIQGTLLQQANSIANTTPISDQNAHGPRDNRRPQLLSSDQFGVNELEATGLTISAPLDDLITPKPLADNQRSTTLPCLFLEDLWVGFRFDIAPEGGQPLLSTHKQTQKITFGSTTVHGETEDFFAREQAADTSVGVSSTELFRYAGLNSAQAIDYRKFLGIYCEPAQRSPFTVEVTGYSGATPLHFSNVYQYRLRNVFLGGISLSDRDTRLNEFDAKYLQSCPFFRARALRAGEIVSPDADATGAPGAGGRTVFLTPQHPNAHIWLVPTPIDSDTARYHGVFAARKNESQRNRRRAFITDVGKYFRKEPPILDYYFDPDVSSIFVKVTMLNGDPDAVNHEFAYANGSYCEVAEHLRLPAIRVRYGQDGQFETFRPIKIAFTASSDRRPTVKFEKTANLVHVARSVVGCH
jgi:hypothetical protein